MLESRVDLKILFGKKFHIKRDDLLGEINGNKARKLYNLINSDLSKYTTIASYGGLQSNAMFSLSLLCKRINKKFLYFSYKNDRILKNPEGNLKNSLENGMQLSIVESLNLEDLRKNVDRKTLFIKQGVADKVAEDGIKLLAEECDKYIDTQEKSMPIFTSSGTGTTAYFLAKHSKNIVITSNMVGSKEYLLSQMSELEDDKEIFEKSIKRLKILEIKKKIPFAKPKREVYDIYASIKSGANIEFDLIYDSPSMLAIRENIDKIGDDILFIHSGGLEGNSTQLERYRYKGIC